MNEWLIAAVALVAGLAPLLAVCALRPAVDGLVALQAASSQATMAMLLIAEGIHRQPFADLALVLAFSSFVGTLAFASFIEVER